MQIRICNRCSAQVPSLPAIVRVTLPVSDPATRQGQVPAEPFALDLSVKLIDPTMDLCAICVLSALVEYMLTASKDAFTPAIARRLQTRIAEAIGPVVGA